ncbi:lipid A biosynthesis acyltransferase [Galbibacter sp. EGI 63066]|uniref:LpxL/LpxP family acyltransferase n=1 Tax=Galbibacter sp. EGI 63066 TaxID=2993559 RepID=UPI002249614B|nr:lipid A biosynthesis acyltransferase [Galbibacter sp. EGI 63066]MCX2678328.1 lipid A biosynthesis acyltransferase [Galbibacter sp. EGI 63066]
MTKWSGKSKGTVLGYKIFIFFIKNVSVRAAYFILYFVALYYLLFSFKSNKAIYYYFRRRLKYSVFKSVIAIYKSYFVFGQTLIDKTAISAGLRNKFTYEFDGINKLKQLLQDGKGGILISAHVGNFEIAEFFFNEVDENSQINLVTTDSEHRAIKEYLESVTSKSEIKFILINEDLSHIYEINNALSNNELVCFTGDRYFEGSKYLETDFLGAPAKFPAGPFLLASRLKTPVAFVYVMKETAKHYHLYTRITSVVHRDAEDLLGKYVGSVEGMLKKYPYQWFNYFDFWEVK